MHRTTELLLIIIKEISKKSDLHESWICLCQMCVPRIPFCLFHVNHIGDYEIIQSRNPLVGFCFSAKRVHIKKTKMYLLPSSLYQDSGNTTLQSTWNEKKRRSVYLFSCFFLSTCNIAQGMQESLFSWHGFTTALRTMLSHDKQRSNRNHRNKRISLKRSTNNIQKAKETNPTSTFPFNEWPTGAKMEKLEEKYSKIMSVADMLGDGSKK